MKRYVLFLVLLLFAAHAQAQPAPQTDIPFWGIAPNVLPERLALVIGVEHYDEPDLFQLPPLPGATSDAKDVEKLALRLGVKQANLVRLPEAGTVRKSVTKTDIENAVTKIRELARKVKALPSRRNPIIVFYFAGHGMNYAGKNLLLPSSFAPSAADLIVSNAIDLANDVIRRLVDDASLLIVVVDACRSPAPPAFDNSRVGTYAPDKQAMSELRKKAGMRVAFLFATLPGEPSEEIAAAGGRFTTALIGAVDGAFAFSKQHPDATIVRSLYDIFTSASDAMATGGSLQVPDWGQIRAGGFHPFPTNATYVFAKTSYEDTLTKNAQRQPVEPTTVEGYKAEICNLYDYLRNFSYHSYFAKQASDRLSYLTTKLEERQASDVKVELMCSQRADFQRVIPGESPLGRSFSDTSPDQRTMQAIPGINDSSRVRSNRVRVAQAQGAKSDAAPAAQPISPTGAPSTDSVPAAGNVPNDAASVVVPDVSKQGSALPMTAKVTVGDVREAAATASARPLPVSRLDAGVALDNAVVARTSLNIRAAPMISAPILTQVSEGELLEVVDQDAGKGWLKVRHPLAGANPGFVDASLVRPALARLSKLISFGKTEYTVSEAAQTDIVTTFALLGGVAIANAVVEYPHAAGALGFARAASVANFLQQRATTSSTKERADLVIRIREDAGNEKMALTEDAVRLTITALALDKSSRATLANNPVQQQPVVLDVEQRPSRDATSAGGLDLKLCSADSTQCGTTAPNVARDVKSAVQDALREAGKSLDALQKLAPMIKF